MTHPISTETQVEPTTDISNGSSNGITTGVVGGSWRATITAWGAIVPWTDATTGRDAGPTLDWWVAASDRWHTPAAEPAVRQTRIDATPVTETRVRVPGGDVVQRIYTVADEDGITIVEFENESTLPIAVALSHRDLLTERPISSVPIEGIDLPSDAFVLPIGHKATARVGLAHRGTVGPTLASMNLPTALAVVRGWMSTLDRAGRYAVPGGDVYGELVAALNAQRCEVILGAVPAAQDDPAGFALALDTLVRIGEPAEPWLDELVTAVEAMGPDSSWRASAGLKSAARVLAATDETRAQRDIQRIIAKRPTATRPDAAPALDDVALGAWLEELFVDHGQLFPQGFPDGWRGQPVEVYRAPTSSASSVSFALRWHGENVAILWEQTGSPVMLTAPSLDSAWSSDQAAGEALLVLDRART